MCRQEKLMLRFMPPSNEEVNRAADLVISACKTVFTKNLECVTLKGSTLKGDFIPGYSDYDFHVFLSPQVMDDERTLKIDYALRFQKAFGHARPEDFGASQFQIYFISSQRYPADWAPPVKGTFKVFFGKLPASIQKADDELYIQQAREYLRMVDSARKTIVGRFVDKPNERVLPVMRLLGATLKSYMHSILILLQKKPQETLRLKLNQMISPVEEGINSEGHFASFFEHVSNWPRVQQDSDYAREAFKEGIEALSKIVFWSQALM
jgi:hypothetical protein